MQTRQERPKLYDAQLCTENHAKDVYCMLKLEPNKVILTRNFIWLKKMYGEWNKSAADEESDDDSSADNLDIHVTEAEREKEDLSIIKITGIGLTKIMIKCHQPVTQSVLNCQERWKRLFVTIARASRASLTITSTTDSPDTGKQSGRDIANDIGNVWIDCFHHAFANYEKAFEVADVEKAFQRVKCD
jgi:hypothetical protein